MKPDQDKIKGYPYLYARSKIIYEYENKRGNVGSIEELGPGVYIFRIIKDNSALLLSTLIVEISEFECEGKIMVASQPTAGIFAKLKWLFTTNDQTTLILQLEPMFEFLEFRYVRLQRSIGGKWHRIRTKR